MLFRSEQLEAPDRRFRGHRDILTRNLARYQFIVPRLRGYALDLGCGRGYGVECIARHTPTCVGIDLTLDFLRDASKQSPRTMFACASGDRLPVIAKLFDSVVSFEVIEHIADDNGFLRELVRVGRESAFFAVSTPNRLIASPGCLRPLNKFHVREYTAQEFRALLGTVFASVEIYGQHERRNQPHSMNSFIDRIPTRWKYLLPLHIQGFLSVALRAPLQPEACRFETHNLELAHTFVALCGNPK